MSRFALLLPLLASSVVACGVYSPTPPEPAPELVDAPAATSAPMPGEMTTFSRRIYEPQARAIDAGYELGLLRTRRYRTTDGKPRLDVQFAFDPESRVELVAGRPRLVGCVTDDGVERIGGSDLLLWTHYPGPGFGASMIEVDASSSGLQSLVVECAVLRIEERVDRVIEGVPAGVSEQLPLGGMLVTVTGEPSICTVAVTFGDASLRQETAPGVPLYGHDWCSSELVVTDADGVRLYRMGGSGSGAMTMRQYVRPDAMGESGRLIAEEPAIAYPVRIDFAEPVRVTSVPCRFEFHDVVLPPLE